MAFGVDGARNVQAQWARLLLASLADAGVREVVISPGSRSTAFVLAALDHPGLRCHDVIDERAAAYFALGMARRSGEPALLLCTSGTAGANYLPAVIEAGMSHLPLLMLTADRPVELAHCAANQTIDQLKLFGDHARRFFDLGLADGSPRALRALRRTIAQGVAASRWPLPGAVHFNARARKPLEPPVEVADAECALEAVVDQLLERPVVRPVLPLSQPDPRAVSSLARSCAEKPRGLIVVGPQAIDHPVAVDPGGGRLEDRSVRVDRMSEQVDRLARHLGFPILVDPASQLRWRGSAVDGDDPAGADPPWVDTFDALLRQERFAEATGPGLILQIGRGPTSGAWERYLERHTEAEHWVLAEHGWPDASSTADHLLFGEPGETLEALCQVVESVGNGALDRSEAGELAPSPSWLGRWLDADRLARVALDDELAATPGLSEGAVARLVAGALGDDDLLVVGNSLPIRQLDLWAPGPGPRLRVASQRGTSGIDGVVAGAAGSALVHGGATVLLVGDVSFLHDLSGLATVRRVGTPLVLVVVQNRGGRIFEQLPVARHPSITAAADSGERLDHWLTTHEADFEHAARLHHLGFARVHRPEELGEALEEALRHPGATVIEAMVPEHGAALQTAALGERLAVALEGWKPPSRGEDRR